MNNIPSICGVNSGTCYTFGSKQWLLFDFDKWLGNDDVIMGSQALGVSLQCWHLNVSVLALECFSAGT